MIREWIEVMNDENVLKGFGKRVKALRKQKRWPQKELAHKVGVHFQQLNKYEGGFHAPPVDKLILLADALGTTVDFLLTGSQSEGQPLHNSRLLERFRQLEQFNIDEQETVIKLVDAFIVQHKMAQTLKAFPITEMR